MYKMLARNEQVHNVIGKQMCFFDTNYKPSQYTVLVQVDYGYVIYQTFTRELILMSTEEYNDLWNNPSKPSDGNWVYLVEHWFLVRDTLDEYGLVEAYDIVQQQKLKPKKIDKINRFTILTTTECNARCPYCYEIGVRKRTMTDKVVNDLSNYILEHSQPSVNLNWFGGEPLVNSKAITVICTNLREAGMKFNSSMISNGYLFDEFDRETLVDLWQLTNVQITLDGTPGNYESIKNYVIPDDNAFQQVIDNMHMLLNYKIRVSVRLNVSKENADDLLDLADILYNEFNGEKLFSVYTCAIFGENQAWNECMKIQNKLLDLKLAHASSLRARPKLGNCMADSMTSLVVTPDGDLSLCEHYSDEQLIGSIYTEGYNTQLVDAWQQRRNDEKCKTCYKRPNCYMLKHCPASPDCAGECCKYEKAMLERAIRDIYEQRKGGLT